MFDKKYEVYFDGHILCGEFNNVRSFVEDYYYTRDIHKEWLAEKREEDEEWRAEIREGTLCEEDYSYEDSVQSYLDYIRAEATPTLNGFEWSGYEFKEVE